MRVVGCIFKHGDKFLLLHRHAHKPDGNTWGLPSGKINEGETDIEAIIRELKEETGYLAAPSEFKLLGKYDFDSPNGYKLEYVTYELNLKQPHTIQLEEKAHSEYKWASVKEADSMDNLIFGLHDLFKLINYI